MTEALLKSTKTIPPLRCFMCFEDNWERLIVKSEEICRRFCVLISRFLDVNLDLVNVKLKKEQTLNKRHKHQLEEGDFLICCRKCVPIIESFCVDYDQLVNLRLELSSDLRRISKLLRSGSNSKGKAKCTGKTEVFQRQLLKQCENFFSTKDFPFLKLERYHRTQPDPETSSVLDLAKSTGTAINVNVVNNNDNDEGDALPLTTNKEPQLLKLLTTKPNTSSIIATVSHHHHGHGHRNENISENERSRTRPGNTSYDENETRKCPTCKEEFNDIGQLILHELRHKKVKGISSFRCNHCDEKFVSRNEWEIHTKKCEQNTATLLQKVVAHSIEKHFAKNPTSNPIRSATNVATMINTNHNDNNHEKNELTPPTPSSTSTLRAHQNQTVTFGGELSKPALSRYNTYRRILPKPSNPEDPDLSHNNQIHKNFKCDHCKKQFSSRLDLCTHQHWDCANHRQTVTLQQQQPQEVQVITAENSDSEEHLINPINDESGSGSTSISTSTTTQTANSFKCSCCDKVFASSVKLKLHKKLHMRPYACRFCDKKFKFPSHLKDHERIHTGARPYQCPECKKSFKQNAHLKEHLKNRHKIDPNLHLLAPRRASNIVGEGQGQIGVKELTFGGDGLLLGRFMENSTSTSTSSCGEQAETGNVEMTEMEFEETPTTLVKSERPKYSGESVAIGNEFILPDLEY